MNKKTIIILAIVCVILIALAVVVGIYALSGNHSNQDPTDNTQVGELGGTTPTDEEGEINGIPSYMFESTSGRAFTFTLKNVVSGEVYTISPTIKYAEITYKFYRDRIEHEEEEEEGEGESVAKEEEINYRPDIVVKAGKTSLIAEATDDVPSGIFTFGVVNESDEDAQFDDSRLIYISYKGNADWELCGIATDMTQEQVIEVLGEPTQAMKVRAGYSMEWYILVDGHTYLINAIFNEKGGEISEIVLSVDNFPLFS